MAFDLFEEVVGSWLQTKGYFIMSNIKYYRNKEIDILATKAGDNKVIHIEVSCSSSPVGILGIQKAGEKDYRAHAQNYVEKKYTNEKAIEKIEELTGQKNIHIDRWFIHAKLKEPRQLEVLKDNKIITKHINEIIKDIKSSELKKFVGDRRMKQLVDIIDTDYEND